MSGITNAIYNRQEFIHELQWNEDIAEFFIQHTTREALKGKYKHGGAITDYLLGVQFEVNRRFGVFFSFRHFKKKLAELENNYTIFTWIINQPAVVFDEKYKKVYASDEQWDQFSKVNLHSCFLSCLNYDVTY